MDVTLLMLKLYVFYMQCVCMLKYEASLLCVLQIQWLRLIVLVALSDVSAGCHTDPKCQQLCGQYSFTIETMATDYKNKIKIVMYIQAPCSAWACEEA